MMRLASIRPAAALLLLAAGAAPSPVGAQGGRATDPSADYSRMLDLTRRDPWHRAVLAPAVSDPASGPAFALHPLELRAFLNSARPWGTNDGSVWQGRGTNFAAAGGFSVEWKFLSASFRPIATRSQNVGFALNPIAPNAGLSPYAYPSDLGLQSIDAPQRFGPDPFSTFDLGASYLRADLGPVAFGVSNEGRWWGPGRRNAIVLTDNAPGFGHAFVRTSRPVDIWIGHLESEWLWGRLRESAYFDADPGNDRRFFTGLRTSITPRGVPNLELGATRTFDIHWPEGGVGADEVLMVFLPLEKKDLITPSNPTGDDAADQLASLYFRWVFPESGAELYGEWGRGDHSRDLRDAFVEPEHASAWLLGMQKAFERPGDALWRFSAEFLTLGGARTTTLRPPPSAFYQHHIVTQGHTNRGQVLGAGIGPGSSQASVGVDRFASWGKLGLGVLRTVYDNNRFYGRPRTHHQHEVEPSLLAEALVFRGRWDLSAGIVRSRLLNRFYVERSDQTNVNLTLGASYHFGPR